MSTEQGKDASQAQPQGKPDEEKLQMSVVAARKVIELQDKAAELKERAKKAVNPKERIRLFQEAYDKEIEAFGQSKYAQRLQSGAWQGAAAGGGIGGGVALGLGTLVGTLVSGLVSVPTVALGGLVGAGVGAFHGPWLTFGKNDGKKVAMTEEDSKSAAMKEAERLDQAVENRASTVPQPPNREGFEDDQTGVNDASIASVDDTGVTTPKRKPKKLQVRSGNEVTVPLAERRKPRKLQVRSAAERSENE